VIECLSLERLISRLDKGNYSKFGATSSDSSGERARHNCQFIKSFYIIDNYSNKLQL